MNPRNDIYRPMWCLKVPRGWRGAWEAAVARMMPFLVSDQPGERDLVAYRRRWGPVAFYGVCAGAGAHEPGMYLGITWGWRATEMAWRVFDGRPVAWYDAAIFAAVAAMIWTVLVLGIAAFFIWALEA